MIVHDDFKIIVHDDFKMMVHDDFKTLDYLSHLFLETTQVYP